MSIPESVIERVRFKNANTCESMEDAERRARRVLAAQAKPEAISGEAVKEARRVYGLYQREDANRAMFLALSAALLHMAGEE